MCHLAASIVAASLMATGTPVAHAQDRGATPSPTPPRLDYQMDGYRDEQLTYGSTPKGFQPRSLPAVPGQPAAAPSVAAPPATAPSPTTPASPPIKPDPAYIGSGLVVNGWYYPPPQVTTVVTDYAPARQPAR